MTVRLASTHCALVTVFAVALSSSAALSEPSDARTASVSGAVVDASGRPVPGAVVWLREGMSPHFSFRSVTAGAKGEFAFDKVRGITLAVVAEGHSYGGMNVRAFQAGRADHLRLVVTEPRELRLHVVDTEGKPVRDVQVEALSWKMAGSDPFGFPLEVLRRARIPAPLSDKRGELSIVDVPAGCQCELQLKHPDYARQIVRALSSDKDAPVKVVLQPGTVVRVEVSEAATGRPAAGARVGLSATASEEQIDEPVDSNGNCQVRVVNPQRFMVFVRHPTLAPRQFFALREADPDTDGNYTLRVALFRQAKVQGRVVDDKGKPVAGITVSLAIEQRVMSYAASDTKGEYVLEGQEGEGIVFVGGDHGFYADDSQRRSVKLAASAATKVPDMVVRRLPPIRGRVVLPDGRPAAKVLVEETEFRAHATSTDANGAFELPLERKPHVFSHLMAGHSSETLAGGATIDFAAVERGEAVRIQLEPESKIRGMFKGPDGRPIADAELMVIASVRHEPFTVLFPVGPARTNQRGEYLFAGLSRHMRYRVQLDFDRDLQPTLPKEFVQLAKDEVEFDVTLADDAAEATEKVPRKPRLPREATELTCQAWINSSPLSLKSLRGKLVLLDFWARHDGAAESALRELQLAHELFASKGVVVIGLHSASVTEAELRKAISQRKLTFPVALDGPQNETAARYDVAFAASRVLIGRDGRVVRDDRLTQNPLMRLRRYALHGAE